MNKKTKIIASAAATIAMCASLAVGGTFALFTSESKVNVAINSGKVDVNANVNNLQAYSGSWNSETFSYDSVVSTTEYSEADSSGYYFANGGFASVSTTENTVTLNRITPMDKVTFDIVIHNDSNVTVQYRTVIKVTEDDGLFNGLEVKIGAEEQVYGGTTTYSHWTTLNAGSDDITVPVSIELPQEAGNEYQDKQCTISYSVEAVQGNAYVFDGEAWLIDAEGNTTEMATLSYALSQAQAGDTIKMAHAGTYDPFTVTTEGVTVEGIIGDTKADSTVFLTTADQNVQLLADNVTLKNVWVEVGAVQSGISWATKGAINAYTAPYNNFTLDGCYFNGNNLVDRAFLFCKSKITVNNCTFENFNYCAFDSMDDNNTPELITITNNTFKGLNVAYDIYAGKGYTGTEKNLVIKDNVSDNGAIVRIWDYAQYVRPTEGSAFNAEVTGNENISLYLTHFDNHYITPIETDETDIVYQMEVGFPEGVASGSYKVTNADGSEITTFGDHKTTRVRNGNVLVYALRAGDYILKNNDHTYLFTVVDHTAGVLGSGYTAVNVRETLADGFCYNLSAGVYEVSNAAGLSAFEKSVNDNGNTYAGKTVMLMDDVDLAGVEWNPIGQTGATQFQGTFDGNGYTISNMTVNNASESTNVSSGLFGWLENTSGVVVTDVKFENANVTGSHYVGVVAGYLSGTVTDCVVNGSIVNGVNMNEDANGDKIGGIVGFINAGSLSGNTVTNSTVKGNRDIGGITGAIIAGSTVENNTVSDTVVAYETVKSYASAGAIVSGRTGFVPDESNVATNVTITLQASVSTAAQLSTALTADADKIEVVLSNNIDLPIATLGTDVPGGGQYRLGGADTQAIDIDLNGKELKLNSTYMLALGANNADATITLKNGTMSSYTSYAQTWNIYDIMFTDCDWVLDGVTFENAVAINNAGSTVTMNNVTINEVNDLYAIWVCAGTELTLNGCTINSAGRAIKISDQYVDQAERQLTTLTVKNTSFTSVKKAAILVGSTAGANITLENVDISGVSADTVNAVWVDNGNQTETGETYTDYASLVTVTGGTKINEP